MAKKAPRKKTPRKKAASAIERPRENAEDALFARVDRQRGWVATVEVGNWRGRERAIEPTDDSAQAAADPETPYLEPWMEQPDGAEEILAYVRAELERDAA
jgi:hypothetical protein